MPGTQLAEPNVLGSTLGGEASGFHTETYNLQQTLTTPAPETLCFDRSAPQRLLLHCRVKTTLCLLTSQSKAELNTQITLVTRSRRKG